MPKRKLACLGAALVLLQPALTQAADRGSVDAANTWTGQQTVKVPFPSKNPTTGEARFPIINGANGFGAVSARSQTMLQIVGQPYGPYGTQEVNLIDGFVYGGVAQYSAERYDLNGARIAPVGAGEAIGTYSFEPFDGVSDSNTAGMIAGATEAQNHATGHHGTDLILTYTPNADTNLRYVGLSISTGGLGGVGIGDTGHQKPPADLGKGTLNVVSDVATSGHFRSMAASPPTLSACGTGGNVIGTDNAGLVTVGSGGVTACTINFVKTPWSPVCVVTMKSHTSPSIDVDQISTTNFTVDFSAAYAGSFYYICQAFQ